MASVSITVMPVCRACRYLSFADLSNAILTGANYNDQTVFAGVDPVAAGMLFVPTAVPIPAAAWLFGSGLGLLGWMRRKPA